MIHQYKLNGYNIVLDVHSGSIHYVDELAYDIIELYKYNSKENIIKIILEKYKDNKEVNEGEILDVIEDIETLINEGQLFSPDIYEEKIKEKKENKQVIKALCLHIAHTCNLTCDYCFAAQGNFHGEKAYMSLEVGKKALDFLIENSGTRRNLEVDFFGGEPLMNFQVIKDIVAYGRELEGKYNKNFRFTLTTNGLLIDDDVIEFANKEMDNVVLSLDGRKEIHDRLRKTPNGKGSYDIILPKFKKLIDARDGKGYYMRGTFTHNNLDFTKDIIHMADLGFTELSMEPVVCDKDDPYALQEEDLPVLYEQYELLAKEMIKRKKEGNPFSFYHYTLDLTNGPCVYKRLVGCGSGTEYMAITPWGELYPCHQFVGHDEFAMGNVWDGIERIDLVEDFNHSNIYSRQECIDCWAKLYCSGGCAANAYHATSNINGIYEYGCKLFKKRIECAIMMNIANEE